VSQILEDEGKKPACTNPHCKAAERFWSGLLLLAVLNRLLLMEFSGHSFIEPASQGIFNETTAVTTRCTLETFGLNLGRSIGSNNNFNDFHAAPPFT
jgi:hypothetical protein